MFMVEQNLTIMFLTDKKFSELTEITKKSYQTFKKSDSSLLILMIIQIMLPFCCHRGHSKGEKPLFMGFFKGVKSFPLDCSGGFGGDIINYSVDVLHLIDNTV